MTAALLCSLSILLCVSVCSASFSWSDCGVPLSQYIHYEGATISSNIQTNTSLSINVVASIVQQINNADTYLSVWRDGEEFLSVGIQDLCSIVETTTSLSCPVKVGLLSFTYTFEQVPILVPGDYILKLHSSIGGQEIACLELSGTVYRQPGSSCLYKSSFSVSIDGDIAYYQNSDDNGTNIQIGPYGDSVPSGSSLSWGIVNNFVGTNDIGGTFDTSYFVWGINGSLVEVADVNDTDITEVYYGDLFVGETSEGEVLPVFLGKFNWTIVYNSANTPVLITGIFWFDPMYSDSSYFNYPATLGNLAPFTMKRQIDGTFLVTGQRVWCTCSVDSCGVCGGDGSSCKPVVPKVSTWTTYKKTAVMAGTIGGGLGLVLVVVIVVLLTRFRRRHRKKHEDQDLIDTPEKPDYGTLAIDEVIQENEQNNGPL